MNASMNKTTNRVMNHGMPGILTGSNIRMNLLCFFYIWKYLTESKSHKTFCNQGSLLLKSDYPTRKQCHLLSLNQITFSVAYWVMILKTIVVYDPHGSKCNV